MREDVGISRAIASRASRCACSPRNRASASARRARSRRLSMSSRLDRTNMPQPTAATVSKTQMTTTP
ncbi:hypothetical protein SALBM217S_06274 [Streptomyces griseoloalbus]